MPSIIDDGNLVASNEKALQSEALTERVREAEILPRLPMRLPDPSSCYIVKCELGRC